MDERISQRRFELDWLRVLAILTVFVAHSGLFFDPEEWHVKNAVTYDALAHWGDFLTTWVMPLIFFISGASLFYAVRKGSPTKFFKDKVLRLLVPLVVGMFTHISLAVYLERATQGGFRGSFIDFLPHYFEGLYGLGGNFAWMGLHLWYLEMLFIYSMAFLPLFLWLRAGSGRRLLERLGGLLSRPGAAWLLVLPGILLINVLPPDNPFLGADLWGGWSLPMFAFYLLGGFVVFSHEGLQERVRRQRWLFLVGAFALLTVYGVLTESPGEETIGTLPFVAVTAVRGLSSWGFVLAIIGFGKQHLNAYKPVLRYANEAVLPFYIMHQTVLLGIGVFVVQWAIPDLLKWVVIVASSFVLVMGLYEFAVRRLNILRVLFGMRPLPSAPAAQPQEAVAVR